MWRAWRLLTAIFAAFLCISLIAFAQTESATISGKVTDVSGAVVVGAQIQIQSIERGTTAKTTTNTLGTYIFPGVRPGRYNVEIQHPGFRQVNALGLTVNVQDRIVENFQLQVGSSIESVTVRAEAPLVNTEDASVSTVVDRNFAENLPLNGRSFNTLLQLTPGVVVAPQANGLAGNQHGQFSIAGQRGDANSMTVDGVSANFGVGADGRFSGESGTGSSQAFSALGGTSSLVSVEALQEFRVETSSFAPEFGKTPGGQIILTTRSGENELHGGLYEYFRNDVMDANDWFANHIGNPRSPERHNDFGGFFGGPIQRNRSFFFFSYEGARLRLPETTTVQVPYLNNTTCVASAAAAPYLLAFPQPNGPVSTSTCTGQFTGSYSDKATLNAASLRIDHRFNDRLSMFARYNYAPSSTTTRGTGLSGITPNSIQGSPVNTQTATVGANILLSNKISNAFRGNYSSQMSSVSWVMDAFGGATPLNLSLIRGSLPANDTIAAFEPVDTAAYFSGPVSRGRTRQANVIDDLTIEAGAHQLKVGGDYRSIFLNKRPYINGVTFTPFSTRGFLSSQSLDLLFTTTQVPYSMLTQSSSLYGQDTWHPAPRLTLTYGLRWELAPAPSPQGSTKLASWLNVNDPADIARAPFGTPLWKTRYTDFAPRVGIAYELSKKGDFVVRAGWGLFYDLGVGGVADLGAFYPNLVNGFAFAVPVPVNNVAQYLPAISLTPPYPDVIAVAPDLKLPRSYQWNVALEKSVGDKQAITATYVGQAGRDQLRQEDLFQPNLSFTGGFILTQNSAFSNYNALQLQYRRPLTRGLQALVNYTFSHSLDNASNDVAVGLAKTSVISGFSDYASSDFDVRHSFSGAVIYAIPAPVTSALLGSVVRGWSVSSVITARTGFPFNAFDQSLSPVTGGFALSRPDLVPGQPIWISNRSAGGGKALNANAFAVPLTLRQGTEGRNDIPGLDLTQMDLSIARKFHITEGVVLQFNADAFNLLNHPNFTNPGAQLEQAPVSLQSAQMLNQGLGGLNPLFQEGGPRSLQLALKLDF